MDIKEEVINKVLSGEIKIYEIESYLIKNMDEEKAYNLAAKIRREILETRKNIDLSVLEQNVNMSSYKRNVEAPIGVVIEPVSIVSLKVRGYYLSLEDKLEKEFDNIIEIPYATTEAALVASSLRGAKAINESGGIDVYILKDEMTRAPLFKAKSVKHAIDSMIWLKNNFSKIKEIAEKETSHGKLLNVYPHLEGRYLILRFSYFTGDAMGMNMVTFCTEEASSFISKETGLEYRAISNFCTDKKTSGVNYLFGRGKTCLTEAVILKKTVKKVLKTTPKLLSEINIEKNHYSSGSAISPFSRNSNFANVITAVFKATGQDGAQVVESSMGTVYMDLTENNDLYYSIYLPCLEVGTVGGGTRLPSNKELLELMGIYSNAEPIGSNSRKLAYAVAAGELSTMAAHATHTLTDAHKKLAR